MEIDHRPKKLKTGLFAGNILRWREAIQPATGGGWMVKVDLKDAYFVVLMKPSHSF